MSEFETVRMKFLERKVVFFGVYFNTLGGKSRVLTGPEIWRRLGKNNVDKLPHSVVSVLEENRIALFENEKQARRIVSLLNSTKTQKER